MPPNPKRPLFSSSLERSSFAWQVLDCEEVLGMFLPFCASSLGHRALAECVPLEAPAARQALACLREMQVLQKWDSPPSLAGFADPLPEDPMDLRAYDEDRFATLRGFLDGAMRLKEWFSIHGGEAPILAEVMGELPDLTPILARIDRTVDERGKVRREASDLLLRLDQKTEALSAQRTAILRTVLARSEIRAVLSDNVVHRRGGRPVLVVRAKSSGRVRGIVHDTSQTGESVFIEPREVIEVGNHLAEAEADRSREVQRVLVELTRAIIERLPRVEAAASTLVKIEWAWIGAEFAAAYGAVAALQPGDPGAGHGLVLRSAQHPLLLDQKANEQIEDVVPIDLRLGETFDMLIVTGPKTGGKTLALKTAGLFALLTHLGLPVPASDGTTIPLYNGIAADIGDEQEIRQNLSTFASHLVRIRDGLACADAETLVLLDELGGGTDPDEVRSPGRGRARNPAQKRRTHPGFDPHRAAQGIRLPPSAGGERLYGIRPGNPGSTLLPVGGHPRRVRSLGDRPSLGHAGRGGAFGRSPHAASRFRVGRADGGMCARRACRRKATRKSAESQLDDAREKAREVDERAQEIERRSDQLEKEAQKGLEERLRDGMRNIDRLRTLLSQVPKEAAGSMGGILDQLEADLSGRHLDRPRARPSSNPSKKARWCICPATGSG